MTIEQVLAVTHVCGLPTDNSSFTASTTSYSTMRSDIYIYRGADEESHLSLVFFSNITSQVRHVRRHFPYTLDISGFPGLPGTEQLPEQPESPQQQHRGVPKVSLGAGLPIVLRNCRGGTSAGMAASSRLVRTAGTSFLRSTPDVP